MGSMLVLMKTQHTQLCVLILHTEHTHSSLEARQHDKALRCAGAVGVEFRIRITDAGQQEGLRLQNRGAACTQGAVE